MPRVATDQLGWGNHNKVVTGTQDGSKQVSKNEWNDSINDAGLLGFTKQSGTIAGNAIVPTGSVIEIQADGTLNTLTTTNNNEFDLIYLIGKAGEDAITITHNSSGGAGNIRLLSGASETLSTTTPMILMCRTISSVLEWSQYGGGIVNALDDIGDVVITGVGNEDVLAYDSTTSKWINQTADESGRVTASSTTTFTNKTIDQDGTGNSITNLADASIKASAGIDATKIADGTVTSAEFQYINTLSSNAQTQLDAKQASLTFGIADTNKVQINGSGTASGEYAKFTSTGIIGEEVADVKTDLSLNNVENTALSTWAGTTNILTLGTIATGTWEATDVAVAHGGTGSSSAGDARTALGVAIGSDVQIYNANTALTTNKISDFASSTSAELAGKISDETGSGALVFGTAPTITLTNGTGLVATTGLTATGTKDGTTFLRGDNTWAVAGGSDTPWSVVHDFDAYYYDMEIQSKPSDPSADNARFYVKEVDSDNDGLFCLIRKNGAFEETQIV